MDARRSFVRIAFASTLVVGLASASATMEAPLAIVLVQAQSEPGTTDPVWIDVGFLTMAAPDQRRSSMGVVGVHGENGETIVYRAVSAAATFNGQLLASAVVELARVNGGSGGGETAVLVVRPDPDEAECLIYDIVGPNVNLHGEAMGRFAVHFVAQRH